MMKFLTKGQLSALIVIAVLVIDQIIKIWVKTSMYWHESIKITDWFYIYFTENNGMAFGMEIFNKFFLTGFRIIAAIGITWLLANYVKKNYKTGFLVCLYSKLATFVPFGEGYSELFYGKVVDMFYFPLIETNWPEWMPFVGGEHFIFFSPIFNFADAAISCGIIAMVLFYGKYLNEIMEQPMTKKAKDNKK